MAKSEAYTLEYLLSVQRDVEEKDLKFINKSYNSLVALFPVKEAFFGTKIRTWAFKCICGNYVVQDLRAVTNSMNKSCGCLSSKKWYMQHMFRALQLSEESTYSIVDFGTNFKTRDWHLKCKVCGVETTSGSAEDHLRSTKKYCKCSKNYIASYEEVKEEVYTFTKDTSWEVLSFPEEYTSKNELRVWLKCKVCGYEVNMRYSNIRKNRGCAECANRRTTLRLSKDTDWFVEKASKVHDFKYDYSNTVYNRAREKVEIICHEHKEPVHFWQSPDNHINKGKGCPECKRCRLRYVSFHKARIEDNKDFYKTIDSGVYIGKISEGLYKIGLSVDQVKRFKEIKKCSGYDMELITYKELSLYDAYFLENYLHKKFNKFNHNFDVEWAGHTECFDLTTVQLEEAVKYIREYN